MCPMRWGWCTQHIHITHIASVTELHICADLDVGARGQKGFVRFNIYTPKYMSDYMLKLQLD